jgi:hypothetical protein
MTMNTTRLTTYWNTGEAATAIEFLDILREALWETYGEQITRMHREACHDHITDTSQSEFEFDDEIQF